MKSTSILGDKKDKVDKVEKNLIALIQLSKRIQFSFSYFMSSMNYECILRFEYKNIERG